MSGADEVLRSAKSVLLIDWPARDVPESLVRAGFAVVVKGGPGPDAYARWESVDGAVVASAPRGPPEQADLVYAYRPPAELPGIVEIARLVGAATVWLHACPADEARHARELVEAAGLGLVVDPGIAERARALRAGR